MVYGYVPTPEIGQLSRLVREWDSGPDDQAPEVNLWEGNADEEAHPLVLELNNHEKDAVYAALAYMDDDGEPDAGAVIRWMMAGAYKGPFPDEAEFARDQFADALGDHIEGWAQRGDVGFPFDVDITEAPGFWEYIGDHLPEGDVWYFVPDDYGTEPGVFVFDKSIDINQYREEE